MITLLSTWTFGVALGFVALGVFVSYKLFSFPDITTDGSFTLGAVTTTVLLVAGHDPAIATLGGAAAVCGLKRQAEQAGLPHALQHGAGHLDNALPRVGVGFHLALQKARILVAQELVVGSEVSRFHGGPGAGFSVQSRAGRAVFRMR